MSFSWQKLRWTARGINIGFRHKSVEVEEGETLFDEDNMSRS